MERSTKKVTRKRIAYSQDELKDLIQIVRRTKGWLQHTQQLHLLNEKSIWVRIADELHMNGWTKRHWTSVRMRGQPSLSQKRPSRIRTSSMLPALWMGNHSISAATARKLGDLGENGNGNVPRATLPPPLIPSSQASACNMLSLLRAGTSDQMVGQSGMSEANSLQIVSVTSRALTESVAAPSSTGPALAVGVGVGGACGVADGVGETAASSSSTGYWRSDSLPSIVATGEKVMERERRQGVDVSVKGVGCVRRPASAVGNWQDIDVLISSDEEMGDGVKASEPICIVDDRTGLCSPSGSTASAQHNMDFVNLWRSEDHAKRMEIYAMKLEVLKLKKAYWKQRLYSLGKVQSLLNNNWPPSTM